MFRTASGDLATVLRTGLHFMARLEAVLTESTTAHKR